MFAIVDVETTGGSTEGNNITEIAIVLHNGKEMEGKFTSLVNPCKPIQKFVQTLTGITDDMVAQAPVFKEIAPNIFNLLKDRVFVAHNVNFDYSLVKQQLAEEGFDLRSDKLCTIRLSEVVFPNLTKYGLGTVCKELNIPFSKRHRAEGDALATTLLLEKLFEHDKAGIIAKHLKRKAYQYLPPNLDIAKLDALPSGPGVYYFHGKGGRVIYVGKATNIKKRVTSHFSNNKATGQKHAFLNEIKNIAHQACASPLAASILESSEIKKLWPEQNKSQKHREHEYGVYVFEDQKGSLRLGAENKKKRMPSLERFATLTEAHAAMKKFALKYDVPHAPLYVKGQADIKTLKTFEEIEAHNQKMKLALEDFGKSKKTLLIKEGSHLVLVPDGTFQAMGNMTSPDWEKTPPKSLQSQLSPYQETDAIRAAIRAHIAKKPETVFLWNGKEWGLQVPE